MSTTEKALHLLRNLPRVAIHNVKDYREFESIRKKEHALPRGKEAKFQIGKDHKGAAQRMTRSRLGHSKASTPYLKVPKEYYYQGVHTMRQYVPLSLLQLQRLIDLGRLNANEPIDLTSICNTNILKLEPSKKQYGIHLIDDGHDLFKSRVNIEIQYVSNELTIAAIERMGGYVTTKYYSMECLQAMSNVKQFLSSGKPIPKNGTPPLNILDYYTSSVQRGYLANPEQIAHERFKLSQKYGYTLGVANALLIQDEEREMLLKRKDPLQIWYDLDPGWIINVKDKTILKSIDKDYINYYKSS